MKMNYDEFHIKRVEGGHKELTDRHYRLERCTWSTVDSRWQLGSVLRCRCFVDRCSIQHCKKNRIHSFISKKSIIHHSVTNHFGSAKLNCIPRATVFIRFTNSRAWSDIRAVVITNQRRNPSFDAYMALLRNSFVQSARSSVIRL